MTRSSRMTTIIGLAERQHEEAARQLIRSQQLLEQCETQLAEMKQCRIDYAAQLLANSGKVRTAAELQSLRVFIQQLDVAIQQLEHQFSERHEANQRMLDQWIKSRNKSNALTDIKIRYQKAEEKITEHREQFEADELSQRK